MKEQTRKEMQQKMAECQMPAPEVSWAEIEQAVAAQRQATPKKQARIIPMLHKRIAAAAAIILLVGGIGYWAWHQQRETGSLQEQIVASVEKVEAPKSATKTVTPAEPATDPKLYASATAHTYHHVIKNNIQIKENHENTQAKEEKEEAQTIINSTQREESAQTIASHSKTMTNTHSQFTATPPATNNRLTAKLYVANTMNSYAGSNTFIPALMSAHPFGTYDEEMDDNAGVPLYGNFQEIKNDIRHHQPLRFGLSIRYAINNRWSVESGLSYSHHKSDLIKQSGDQKTITEQQLSYVGIPLSAQYLIWNIGRLNLYASAGGMVEKMVKGKRTTQPSPTNNTPEASTTESVSISPLQFSLNCALGAEFQVAKSLSLYAEPGLGYYFDNGSTVPTIYQDKPLNLNLSFGLRFSFE